MNIFTLTAFVVSVNDKSSLLLCTASTHETDMFDPDIQNANVIFDMPKV